MRRWVLIFDIVMLVLFVIAFIPSLTGVAAHEWLGLVVLVVFIVHMALNVDQVWGTIKRLFHRSSGTGASAEESDGGQSTGDVDAEIAADADAPVDVASADAGTPVAFASADADGTAAEESFEMPSTVPDANFVVAASAAASEPAAASDIPDSSSTGDDADLAAAANAASDSSSAGSGMGMRVLRLVLNIALLVDLVVCVVSGLLISGAVLPTFGLYVPEGYYFWNPLHSTSAMILLALILVHIVIHFRWIIGNFRRKKRTK